jgi:PRTRC genetic system protein C
MIGLFLIVLLLIGVMVVISKGFTRFSTIFSGQMTFIIVGIYVLLGFSSFVYLVIAKGQHIEAIPKALEGEHSQQNEQMLAHLSEGKMDQIDSSYVLATYVVEAQSTELSFRQNEEDALTAFIQYRDDLDSNEIRVTAYKNFFSYNGFDLTDVSPKLNVDIVDNIFYITSSYKNLKIANVKGQLSVVEDGIHKSRGLYATGFNQVVFIEVPNHITIRDDDSLIIVK